MPSLIVPDTIPAYPATLTTPADGDPANAASVNVAFQALENGTDGARRMLTTSARTAYRYRSTDGLNITFGPIGAYPLFNAAWVTAGINVTTTFAASTKLGAGLAALTRYYVYAGLTAGVPDFLVSTNAPAGDLRFMSGNNAWYLVGTFITDSASKIVPQIGTERGVEYLGPGASFIFGAPHTLRILAVNAGAGAWTDVPLGLGVPSFASTARIAYQVGSSAGNVSIFLGPDSVSAAGWTEGFGTSCNIRINAANDIVTGEALLALSSGLIRYSANATEGVTLGVAGFGY